MFLLKLYFDAHDVLNVTTSFFLYVKKHGHDHAKEEDIPAWKKRALESGADASAAPFGGTWGAESSMDATK